MTYCIFSGAQILETPRFNYNLRKLIRYLETTETAGRFTFLNVTEDFG